LPVFEFGGSQTLLDLKNDQSSHMLPLDELNNQLVLVLDGNYNFLVYLLDDIEDLERGSVLDIEGGVGTSFKSLNVYLACEALQFLLFDDQSED